MLKWGRKERSFLPLVYMRLVVLNTRSAFQFVLVLAKVEQGQ